MLITLLMNWLTLKVQQTVLYGFYNKIIPNSEKSFFSGLELEWFTLNAKHCLHFYLIINVPQLILLFFHNKSIAYIRKLGAFTIWTFVQYLQKIILICLKLFPF